MPRHAGSIPSTTTWRLRAPASASRTRDRALTVVVAAVAALLAWVVAVPIAGVELAARPGSSVDDVGAGSIVGAVIVAGLAGWALLALVERRAPRRVRGVWTVTSLAVLAVSIPGPLSAVTVGAGIALAGLHLLVAAILVVGLRRTVRAG